MGEPIIEIKDSNYCYANKEARAIILPCLAYKSKQIKRNKYGGKTIEYVKSHMITGRKGSGGHFLAGLLPMIEDKYPEVQIINEDILEFLAPDRMGPSLPGIKFRPDQKKALRAVRRNHRGKIVFPTGSGKTVIAAGIFSMFPKDRRLFLCHTKDLLNQTTEEMQKFFGKGSVFAIGGGAKYSWAEIDKEAKTNGVIVVATIQTVARIPREKYGLFFDVVIVDETHHVNDIKSQYGKVLLNLVAPRKYGLTATVPTNEYQNLCNTGLIGPTISELTISEGVSKGILAKPKMILVPVPYSQQLNKKAAGKYRNFYKYCIVQNRKRNVLIADRTKKMYNKGRSTLIIIEDIDHGKRIKRTIEKRLGIGVPFVHGSTPKPEREKVKKQLFQQKIKVVVCSKIWKEGINIPTLNQIINACGYKDEKSVLQALGRGLRIADRKKTICLVDFLDPYRYLAEHSVARIQVYVREGWL